MYTKTGVGVGDWGLLRRRHKRVGRAEPACRRRTRLAISDFTSSTFFSSITAYFCSTERSIAFSQAVRASSATPTFFATSSLATSSRAAVARRHRLDSG